MGDTPAMPPPVASMDRALVWFRRDLRADDHAALYAACRTARRVFCGFVLDTQILGIPHALGQDLKFLAAEGPQLSPPLIDAALESLEAVPARLEPVA